MLLYKLKEGSFFLFLLLLALQLYKEQEEDILGYFVYNKDGFAHTNVHLTVCSQNNSTINVHQQTSFDISQCQMLQIKKLQDET